MTKPELIIGPNTAELQRLLLQTKPEDKRLNHIQSLLLRQIEKKQFPAVGREKRVIQDHGMRRIACIQTTATTMQPTYGQLPLHSPGTEVTIQWLNL